MDRSEEPEEFPPILRAPHCRAVERTVEFGQVDGKPLTGLFATFDGAPPEGPRVLVIADAAGLDDATRDIVRRLAGEGYVTLAVELPAAMLRTGARAGTQAALPPRLGPAAEKVLMQAVDYLDVNGATSMAAIGFGTGASAAIRLALIPTTDFDAVFEFDGQPVTDYAALTRLKTNIIGFHASLDRVSTPARLEMMDGMMYDDAKMDGRFTYTTYQGVRPGFFFPDRPTYKPNQAAHAWSNLLEALLYRLTQRE